MKQKLRMGMVGGGPGSFIGAVHRMAANLDGEIELVCGAFSSSAEKSKLTGDSLGLPQERVYGSFEEMIATEKTLPAEQRMQFVSIVTPNHMHYAPAALALQNGFHVIMDKPLVLNMEEAKTLQTLVQETGLLFCLTHTYTGYPMIKEARQQVLQGKLGNIRKVHVYYPQGWLSEYLEGGDNKQASWRTDPGKSGKAGAMGDIGSHAFNLAEYITGLQVTKLCADINIVVPNRQLDDDGAVLLKFNNGASGLLLATQVAAGEENNVTVQVYGDKGGLEWKQEDCNTLFLKWPDAPAQKLRTGGGYVSSFAQHSTRVPAGHPEGYLEAFANLYRNFALTLQARLAGITPPPEYLDYPGIIDGIRGMQFIDTVIESGKSETKWLPFP